MYSRSHNLVIIKPKYHIIHFIKENSFFNKIIGYNKNINIINNYKL